MRRDDLRRMPLCGGDESLSHDGHWECINNWSDAMGATDPVSDAELFELWQQLAAEDAEWRAKALDAIGRAAALQHWLTDPCEMCEGSGLDQTGQGDQLPCDACDGRGWVPKEGGYYRLDPSLDQRSLTPVLAVPLDWMEDDDE